MQTTWQRVMVIDDTYVDRYVAEKLIHKFSFSAEVLSMASAQDALNFLEQQADTGSLPELIFLDISMPEMDGFQFLQAFARMPSFISGYSRIVMLTSSLNTSDSEHAMTYPGVVGFLNKPLDADKLKSIPVTLERHNKSNVL